MADRYRIEYDANGNERIIFLPCRHCGTCSFFDEGVCRKEAERIKKRATSEACGDYMEVVADDREDEFRANDLLEASEREDISGGADSERMGERDTTSDT